MKKENKKILNNFIKRFSIIICIKFTIIFFFFLHNQQIVEKNQAPLRKPYFCFSGNCINLLVAKTPQERELGLMFRENLEENQGMLFIFDGIGEHGMGMRNTLIPLDIIRLTTGYKITDIQQMTPCKEENCHTYRPENENLRAIEINSGTIKKIGLKTGDTIDLKL